MMDKIEMILVFMDPEAKGEMYITWNVDTEIQSVLNICRLHDCKFIYLLKCNCDTKSSTHSAFTVTHGHAQRDENFELPNAHVPRLNKETLCLLVSGLLL